MEEGNSLLQDIESEMSLPTASVGQRFLNFIIDSIAYYILTYVVGFFIGVIILAANGGNRISIPQDDDSGFSATNLQIILVLFNIILLILYYALFEKLAKGKTIGKLVTGTKVINKDGSDITWKQAFLRSIIRYVPFEPLSCFGGYPWHDTWSNTTVVKTR